MKTKVDQSIHFDKPPCRQMSFSGPKWTPQDRSLKVFSIHSTQPVGTVSKCTEDAENVYAPFVMVSIWGQKRTLADKTVDQNGSIDTSFDPPLFS